MANRVQILWNDILEMNKVEPIGKKGKELKQIQIESKLKQLYKIGLRYNIIEVSLILRFKKNPAIEDNATLYFTNLDVDEVGDYLKAIFSMNNKYSLINYSTKTINPLDGLKKLF